MTNYPVIAGMDSATQRDLMARMYATGTCAYRVFYDETGGLAYNVVDSLTEDAIADANMFASYITEASQREVVRQLAPFYPQQRGVRSFLLGDVSSPALLQHDQWGRR